MQTLGIEWPDQSSELVVSRERAFVEVLLKVALEHAEAKRVGNRTEYNGAAEDGMWLPTGPASFLPLFATRSVRRAAR